MFICAFTRSRLGEQTHTLVPCWMPKPLPPRNQCACWFAPTHSLSGRFLCYFMFFFKLSFATLTKEGENVHYIIELGEKALLQMSIPLIHTT